MGQVFSEAFIKETISILNEIDYRQVEALAQGLASLRLRGGRLFILGVGGSAGHASHAVNDFRKICNIESYAPTDNASELTARVNDDGWDSSFSNWLKVSRLSEKDALLIFSVGGGDQKNNLSMNLVHAINEAKAVRARVYGIVGKNGGYTAANADACAVIPPLFSQHVTPHTEGLCAVIWHLLVSHPALKENQTTWEKKGALPL